ncbi:LOW QUALITY PROTEIN: Sperm acrosome membrane-associated protein 6 [Galemys pyrenaicus]|uniref:Sperm acrosome membrane-associated protein 6 n=1 Tax=Galemys pyrenaicus TaxID=202257 RepID=A0A8J6A3A5_GALPY|nr:LOW QUALITY PROTEIN: Sperm acrosome membrane-associated protein 6 [Galemys pyrenaicus]
MAPLAPAALLVLTALGAPAWACLRCFTTYKERVRVCQSFVGRGSRQVDKCEQAFEDAFRGLRDVEINYYERSHLHDTFTQMTFSLEEVAHDNHLSWGPSHDYPGNNAVSPSRSCRLHSSLRSSSQPQGLRGEGRDVVGPTPGTWSGGLRMSCSYPETRKSLGKVNQVLTQHLLGGGCESRGKVRPGEGSCPDWGRQPQPSPAPAPPGFQEAARRFRCLGCYSYICDFPLDCPVQDVAVIRGRQALFSCAVNFQLPAGELSYYWKFAGGVSRGGAAPARKIRTKDQAYFQGSPQAGGPVARIRPVQPTHRGTFCCVIEHDKLPVARLYFFLNVTGAPPREETELQVAFRQVVSWAPRETRVLEPWTPGLGELLARPDALTPDNQWLLAAAVACASASATLLVW